jgi:hypothetical protein
MIWIWCHAEFHLWRMTKGDVALIPIHVLGRLKELWGPDAHEFKYECSSTVVPIFLN